MGDIRRRMKNALVDSATGEQANAWNAEQTGVGGTSNAVDLKYSSVATAFGVVDGAATITVQYSQDNVNFYDSQNTQAATTDFAIDFRPGARYVRLKSSADVEATATIAGKN